MNMKTKEDRRESERQQRIRRRRVVWNKLARRKKLHDGWICDVSRDGLALLVRNGTRPRVGELVEVIYHGNPLLCTVVRRQSIEQTGAVLGCRAEGGIAPSVSAFHGYDDPSQAHSEFTKRAA